MKIFLKTSEVVKKGTRKKTVCFNSSPPRIITLQFLFTKISQFAPSSVNNKTRILNELLNLPEVATQGVL